MTTSDVHAFEVRDAICPWCRKTIAEGEHDNLGDGDAMVCLAPGRSDKAPTECGAPGGRAGLTCRLPAGHGEHAARDQRWTSSPETAQPNDLAGDPGLWSCKCGRQQGRCPCFAAGAEATAWRWALADGDRVTLASAPDCVGVVKGVTHRAYVEWPGETMSGPHDASKLRRERATHAAHEGGAAAKAEEKEGSTGRTVAPRRNAGSHVESVGPGLAVAAPDASNTGGSNGG